MEDVTQKRGRKSVNDLRKSKISGDAADGYRKAAVDGGALRGIICMINVKTGKRIVIENKRKAIFSLVMLAVPIAHFLVFYLYINLSSFSLAFKKYEIREDVGLVSSFAKLDNFKDACRILFGASGWSKIKNSLIFESVNLFLVTPLTLIFAFYIYKRAFMGKFFKVMLFMPYILSEIIVATIYKYMTNNVIPYIFEQWFGMKIPQLLADSKTQMVTAIVFNMIMWLGINSLIYSSAMEEVNVSMSEAAQLDGANVAQEFVYVTIPTIFPTIVTLFIVALAAVFTDQFRMLSLFYYLPGELDNMGFYLFMQASRTDVIPTATADLTYGGLSAMGLLLSFVVIPVTLVTRHLLNKYGPRAD